jgi:hypothetical protein
VLTSFPVIIFVVVLMIIFVVISALISLTKKDIITIREPTQYSGLEQSPILKTITIDDQETFMLEFAIQTTANADRIALIKNELLYDSNSFSEEQKIYMRYERDKLQNYLNDGRKSLLKSLAKENADFFKGTPSCFILLRHAGSEAKCADFSKMEMNKGDDAKFLYVVARDGKADWYSCDNENDVLAKYSENKELKKRVTTSGSHGKIQYWEYYGECLYDE